MVHFSSTARAAAIRALFFSSFRSWGQQESTRQIWENTQCLECFRAFRNLSLGLTSDDFIGRINHLLETNKAGIKLYYQFSFVMKLISLTNIFFYKSRALDLNLNHLVQAVRRSTELSEFILSVHFPRSCWEWRVNLVLGRDSTDIMHRELEYNSIDLRSLNAA